VPEPQPPENLYLSSLNNFFNSVATNSNFLKVEEYLKNDKKYLQQQKNIFYFVLRIGKNRVIKRSLGTSNQIQANIRKSLILYHFSLNSSKRLKMIQDMLKIITIIEEDDDREEANKIIQDIQLKAIETHQKTQKTNNISFSIDEEIKHTTLKEEVENFYKDYKKTNENYENRIKEFESTFKYLFLKFPENTRILNILNYEDWDNFRDFLIELPNTAIRRFGTKKHGKDINKIIENILNEKEEKNEEVVLLNNRTINKHFSIFSMFLNYLVRTKKIKNNVIQSMPELKEIQNPYLNFEDEDVIKLFEKTKEKEIKNFYKVAMYTGLRLSAIININKDDIDLKNNILSVPKDKTTNGIRKISIHKKIRNILKDFKNSNKEFLFYDTNNKDKIQKKINKKIFEILQVRKTIHGFRKSFTIKLFQVTKDINLRKYVVGHSQKNDLTFTIYNLENIDFKAFL